MPAATRPFSHLDTAFSTHKDFDELMHSAPRPPQAPSKERPDPLVETKGKNVGED